MVENFPTKERCIIGIDDEDSCEEKIPVSTPQDIQVFYEAMIASQFWKVCSKPKMSLKYSLTHTVDRRTAYICDQDSLIYDANDHANRNIIALEIQIDEDSF